MTAKQIDDGLNVLLGTGLGLGVGIAFSLNFWQTFFAVVAFVLLFMRARHEP